MKLTVSEAATKYCPHDASGDQRCRTNRCMAWRWSNLDHAFVTTELRWTEGDPEPHPVPPHDDGGTYRWEVNSIGDVYVRPQRNEKLRNEKLRSITWKRLTDVPQGYCGLAGPPDR